jgi:hypothetical protein
MFDSDQKSTGTGYTTTVALFIMGFIFCPAVLIVSRPVGYVSLSLAIACSALCLTLAWVNWKKSSRLTIPSIAIRGARVKMTKARVLTIPIMCAVLGGSLLGAEDFSNNRGLQFGLNLAAAAKQAGTKPTETRFVHQRPAVIQEMDWQPRPPVLADPVKADHACMASSITLPIVGCFALA